MIRIFIFMFSLNVYAEEIKYAPVQKEMRGHKKILCVGLKWKNQQRHTSAGECSSLASNTANVFNKLSRGAMTYTTKGVMYETGLTAAIKNLNKAINAAKSRWPGYDIYMMVDLLEQRSVSNAGGGVARLKTTRSAFHEVGHLHGLGHSGMYDRKGKLDGYGDKASFMSRWSGKWITAPQLAHLGWTPERELALGEPGKVYALKKITKFDGDGIAAVMIKREGKRDAFLSWPPGCNDKACVALHLQNGGGSQLIKTIKGEFYDSRFTGLHIKIISKSEGLTEIVFDYESKPAKSK